MRENDYIKFYGENKISPVNQDISDFELHLRRREKLYRQCGIPVFAFNNADALEVGPGGGHNALALFEWGINHIDMVEPNPTGVFTIEELYNSRDIDCDLYSIYNTSFEQFESKSKYDIAIAEGFLQYIPNSRDICEKLMSMVKKGGVIVITCADDLCMFVEVMKRLAGHYIAGKDGTTEEKVNRLVPVFEPQLKNLRGVSRPAKDWIYDNVFNPATINGIEFSMRDALDCFMGFDLLGCSPRMFTDYSWYKDIWFDEYTDYKDQFNRKRMSLVLAGISEQILDIDIYSAIYDDISRVLQLEAEYERTYDNSLFSSMFAVLNDSIMLVERWLCKDFAAVYKDIACLVEMMDLGKEIDMSMFSHLFGAFGRGQQYMSFMKTQ